MRAFVVCLFATVLVRATGAQVVVDYRLDIFYRSTWVGETSTRVEKTRLNNQAALKMTRETRLTTSIGRIKPMYSQLEQTTTEDGDLLSLRYTYSSGLEIQEMSARWSGDDLIVTRRGYGSAGAYEPVEERIPRKDAKHVGGSPLDSLLFGSVAKRSTVALSLDFESKKLEENVIEFVGEATIRQKDKSIPALEFRVMRGRAVAYRVFIDVATQAPLRIESQDGMLMLPSTKRA